MPTSNGTPAPSRAFGLEIETTFPVRGLPPAGPALHDRHTRLELASREELDRDWRSEEAVRISIGRRRGDGRVLSTIDVHDPGGYLFHATGHGWFWSSLDGTRVRCAPTRVAPWRWQRYLIGQVLPFVALVQGLEVFHASAVALDGEAIAMVGRPGAGKTTLAVNLALQGAGFLTDDVLAVEPDGERVTAHPGAAIAKIRDPARELLSIDALAALGPRVGRESGSVRFAVDGHGAVPLRSIYFLDPRPDAASLSVEPVSSDAPHLLLSSTFNFAVRTPERRASQLDICARMFDSCGLYRAIVPTTPARPELAAELAAHASVPLASSGTSR